MKLQPAEKHETVTRPTGVKTLTLTAKEAGWCSSAILEVFRAIGDETCPLLSAHERMALQEALDLLQ